MTCCVPYCESKKSKSTFGIPKNLELVKAWEAAIGISLKRHHRVCVNHFDIKDVTKEWVSGQGLSKYTIELQKPKLKNGAVPIKINLHKKLLEIVDETKIIKRTVPLKTYSSIAKSKHNIYIPLNNNYKVESSQVAISESSSPPLSKKLKTTVDNYIQREHCYFKVEVPTQYLTTVDNCENSTNVPINDENSNNVPVGLPIVASYESIADVDIKCENSYDVSTPESELFHSTINSINFMNLPVHWFSDVQKHDVLNETAIYFHKLSPCRENFVRYVEKQLILKNDTSICINMNGKDIITADIGLAPNYRPESITDLENFLKILDQVKVCQGCDSSNNHKNIVSKLRSDFVESFGRWRHAKCAVILKTSNSSMCSWCKKFPYHIKSIKNQDDSNSKENNSLNKLAEIKRQKSLVTKRLSRATIRINYLQNSLNEVKNELKELSNSSIERVLENTNIPECQKELIREIYNTSKVVNPKNRKYSMNWMLFCLLFQVRSPSGYTFLRNQNMLPLPCIRTVKNHLLAVKSNSDVDPNLLKLLKQSSPKKINVKKKDKLQSKKITAKDTSNVDTTTLSNADHEDFEEEIQSEKEGNRNANRELVYILQKLSDDSVQPVETVDLANNINTLESE